MHGGHRIDADRVISVTLARIGRRASGPDQVQRPVAAAGQAGLAEDQFGQPQPDQLVGVAPGNAPPQAVGADQFEGSALRRRKPLHQVRRLAHPEAFPAWPAARAGSFPVAASIQ